jgi:hypothetical protein
MGPQDGPQGAAPPVAVGAQAPLGVRAGPAIKPSEEQWEILEIRPAV